MYHFTIKSFVGSDIRLVHPISHKLQTNNVNIALLYFVLNLLFFRTFAGAFPVRNTCAVLFIRILQSVKVKKSLFVVC